MKQTKPNLFLSSLALSRFARRCNTPPKSRSRPAVHLVIPISSIPVFLIHCLSGIETRSAPASLAATRPGFTFYVATRSIHKQKAMRGKRMADFSSPFVGITRIRFKGFV
jgi:hypothetical protein